MSRMLFPAIAGILRWTDQLIRELEEPLCAVDLFHRVIFVQAGLDVVITDVPGVLPLDQVAMKLGAHALF